MRGADNKATKLPFFKHINSTERAYPNKTEQEKPSQSKRQPSHSTSQIQLISCPVKFCHLTHPLKGQGYGLNKQADMELFPHIRHNLAETKQQILQILSILKI